MSPEIRKLIFYSSIQGDTEKKISGEQPKIRVKAIYFSRNQPNYKEHLILIGYPIVKANINSAEIIALLDTRAEINIISFEFTRELEFLIKCE